MEELKNPIKKKSGVPIDMRIGGRKVGKMAKAKADIAIISGGSGSVEQCFKNSTYPEAFKVMRYGCKKCRNVQLVWNSRNGVSPFSIGCSCGGSADHIQWERDKLCIEVDVAIMEGAKKMFISPSPERYVEFVKEHVQKNWDHFSEGFDSFHEACCAKVAQYREGEPLTVSIKEHPNASRQALTIAGLITKEEVEQTLEPSKEQPEEVIDEKGKHRRAMLLQYGCQNRSDRRNVKKKGKRASRHQRGKSRK